MLWTTDLLRRPLIATAERYPFHRLHRHHYQSLPTHTTEHTLNPFLSPSPPSSPITIRVRQLWGDNTPSGCGWYFFADRTCNRSSFPRRFHEQTLLFALIAKNGNIDTKILLKELCLNCRKLMSRMPSSTWMLAGSRTRWNVDCIAYISLSRR